MTADERAIFERRFKMYSDEVALFQTVEDFKWSKTAD